jgi:hypothetical protein
MPVYHIYPLDDTFDHEYNGMDCPCHPTVRVETAPWDYRCNILIVHNSFDGREHSTERSLREVNERGVS